MHSKLGKIFLGIGSFLVLSAVGALLVLHFTAGNASDTEPATFNGSWSGQINSANFVAVITDDVITIQWNDKNSSALYWKGSFVTPVNPHLGDAFDVTSAGDTNAMSESLLGSLDASKTFTYADRKISFKMTVAGVTTTVHLEKTNDASA